MQLNNRVHTMASLFHQQPFYQFGNIKLMVIDGLLQFEMVQQKIDIDTIFGH